MAGPSPRAQTVGHRLETVSTLVSRVTPATGVLALSLDVIGCRPGGRNALPRGTWRGLFAQTLETVDRLPVRRRDPLRLTAPVIRDLLLAARALVDGKLELAEDAVAAAEVTLQELVLGITDVDIEDLIRDGDELVGVGSG